MSKAQAFTVDVLFAFVIFIIVLVFFFQVQQDVTNRSFEMQEQFENSVRLDKVITSLFLQADDSYISVIDETHRFIVLEKVDYLFNKTQNNYTGLKRDLGLADKEIFIQSYIQNGNSYTLYFQEGNFSVTNEVYQKELLFSLENKTAMKFIIGVFS